MTRDDLNRPATRRYLTALAARVSDAHGLRLARVRPLPASSRYDGQANPHTRIIWLAPIAPIHTVPHELAHLAAPDDRDHGADWRDAFVRLALWIVENEPTPPPLALNPG